nr:G1 family glutamic endopeptidase [Pseudonocardia acidicola]
MLGAAALLVGPAAAPIGAQAAASAHGSFATLHSAADTNAQVGHPFNQNGGNWSGYVATGLVAESVSASWIEPTVTCNATNDTFAPWVGIGGYGTTTLAQTGVEISCSSGSPVYRAWYELIPASPVYDDAAVGPGDAIKAEVIRAGTRYTMTVTDRTRNWTRTVTKSYAGSSTSAEFILESPTGTYPNFGTVTFTGATVNGRQLSRYRPVALDASNASGGFDDHTGPLSGGTFSVSYRRGAADQT